MKNCDRIRTDKNCNIIIEDPFDENFVNIYIIKHIAADGDSQSIVVLKEKESDKVICTFKKDGHYNICKIDVPLDELNPYYYREGKFYKNINEVELREIIEVNPEVSKLNVEYEDYFCKCHLWNCYVKVCQEIFDKRASTRCDTPAVDSSLIYKRDLLNSTINVIDYMTYLGQWVEAQRLLERISGCNGLCNTESNTKSCGCMSMS